MWLDTFRAIDGNRHKRRWPISMAGCLPGRTLRRSRSGPGRKSALPLLNRISSSLALALSAAIGGAMLSELVHRRASRKGTASQPFASDTVTITVGEDGLLTAAYGAAWLPRPVSEALFFFHRSGAYFSMPLSETTALPQVSDLPSCGNTGRASPSGSRVHPASESSGTPSSEAGPTPSWASKTSGK